MAALILLAIKTSIMLMVFALGLSTRPKDLTYVISRPWLLARSILSIHLVVPLATALMISLFDLNPLVKMALISLAVSPIPPLLPKKTAKLSDGSYGIGLLLVVALASILIVPLSVKLLGGAFGREAQFSISAVAIIIAENMLAPIAAGLVVRHFAGALAERIAKPISRFAPILLIVAVLPVLFKAAPAIWSLVGSGTLPAIVAFILVGLAAGHLLGGPEPANRTVLAIASSSRHPGIAIAIMGANFDNAKPATAAILLYLILNIVVAIPYRAWRKHAFGDDEPA
jgi:bile acid:Na+ symporter, BASS family